MQNQGIFCVVILKKKHWSLKKMAKGKNVNSQEEIQAGKRVGKG